MSTETHPGGVGRRSHVRASWTAVRQGWGQVPHPPGAPDQVLGRHRGERPLDLSQLSATVWMRKYVWWAFAWDIACALTAGALALEVRFSASHLPITYVLFSLALPALWWGALALADAYELGFIGVGAEEFRRVLFAAAGLAGGIAISSYALKLSLARSYLGVALSAALVFDLLARYWLRKRLHKKRKAGLSMQRVIAVGHAPAVADLIMTLRRHTYHGLAVVGVCLIGRSAMSEVAGVPVYGGLTGVTGAIERHGADTVAVLACPEINATRLRELSWQLEETNTALCVAPAVLDIAGPRTTIRPVAGLPLLYTDHVRLNGGKRIIKSIFDRVAAGTALIMLAPVFAFITLAIRLDDRGPAVFRQTRVGKDGRLFRLYKFRTMVVDAERHLAELSACNEGAGALFKMRADPRVTRVGARLRRSSLDELPQLFNVLIGDMSLVGPRPALPSEAARHSDHMRRRLVVKPGITGLWQVSGRSDLPWEEAVRLDIRYVEHWSLMLDLQILWKTVSAVIRRSGAY